MLPLPRRRLDPQVVRDRLRALAGTAPAAVREVEALEQLEVAETSAPGAVARTALRPVLAAIAATVLAAWVVVRLTAGGPPTPLELAPGSPVASAPGVLAASSPTPASGPSASASALVVHVLGQVRSPGLVRLTPGSRVADAIRAAGGLVRGGSSGSLNLARLVTDGEQIVVTPDAPPDPTGGAAATGGSDGKVVDLNSATASDLDTLPGVGPVTAARILEWRTAHGRFSSVEQLREVSGIGAVTFERLKPHVRV